MEREYKIQLTPSGLLLVLEWSYDRYVVRECDPVSTVEDWTELDSKVYRFGGKYYISMEDFFYTTLLDAKKEWYRRVDR